MVLYLHHPTCLCDVQDYFDDQADVVPRLYACIRDVSVLNPSILRVFIVVLSDHPGTNIASFRSRTVDRRRS